MAHSPPSTLDRVSIAFLSTGLRNGSAGFSNGAKTWGIDVHLPICWKDYAYMCVVVVWRKLRRQNKVMLNNFMSLVENKPKADNNKYQCLNLFIQKQKILFRNSDQKY